MRRLAHLDAPERGREAPAGRGWRRCAAAAPTRLGSRRRQRGRTASAPAAASARRAPSRRRAPAGHDPARTSSASAPASSTARPAVGMGGCTMSCTVPARTRAGPAGTPPSPPPARAAPPARPPRSASTKLPLLEGARPRRRALRVPSGNTTTLVPPRMRSAARSRLVRARNALAAVDADVAGSVEVQADHGHEVQRALVDDAEVHGQVAEEHRDVERARRGWRRRRPAPRAALAPRPRTSTPQRPRRSRRPGRGHPPGERRRAAQEAERGSAGRPRRTV